MASREPLHRLVDNLPEAELLAAQRLLEYLASLATKSRLQQLIATLPDAEVPAAERFLAYLGASVPDSTPPAPPELKPSVKIEPRRPQSSPANRPTEAPTGESPELSDGLDALLEGFAEAIETGYQLAISDDQSEFMNLYGQRFTDRDLPFRAEATGQRITVGVVEPSGAAFQLPFAISPLTPKFRASVSSAIAQLLNDHPERPTLWEGYLAGGDDLMLRLDASPPRLTLMRNLPDRGPEVLGELLIGEA